MAEGCCKELKICYANLKPWPNKHTSSETPLNSTFPLKTHPKPTKGHQTLIANPIIQLKTLRTPTKIHHVLRCFTRLLTLTQKPSKTESIPLNTHQKPFKPKRKPTPSPSKTTFSNKSSYSSLNLSPQLQLLGCFQRPPGQLIQQCREGIGLFAVEVEAQQRSGARQEFPSCVRLGWVTGVEECKGMV